MELLYTEHENTAVEPDNTNVYLACFTTAHARLKLYELLHRLGRRVLYYDTDSVIYRHRSEERDLAPLGSYLGDLTDELGDGRHITEFVSTGPKSYAYRDQHDHVTCKFKGITKTLYNLRVVNLESMLECIQEGTVRIQEGGDPMDVSDIPDQRKPRNLIFRLDRHGRIRTYYQMKVFRMVYDKRYIGDDYVTFPWGF